MAIEGHTIEVLGAGYDTYPWCMREYGVNTLAMQICPPDENGWCNVGCYGVTSHSVANKDPNIVKKLDFIDATGVYPAPGPYEDNYIHVSELDHIIENPTEMMALPIPQPTEVDERVASFILPYINPGDKVQIGFGGLGEEILANLKNLPGSFEVFSEVLCDSMMPLVESGKITKIVASSPGACSEAQGLKPYTGMGGSFAYIYGAMRAKGGRSFTCLHSTYVDKAGETKSNIVPWLPEGSIVSMLKNYVMFIVSEWGLADVYLKTYVDRIKALIKIAHPDFRPWLKEQILTTPLIEEWDFRDYDMNDYTPPAPRKVNNCVPTRFYNLPVTGQD